MTYRKLAATYYDLTTHPRDTAAQQFYLAQAQRANGPILEPMCGSGRFLIPLLQAGHDIAGFDASQDMLDALRRRWAQISPTPAPVWQELVQNFTSQQQYQLIFIPYGSWGLITNLAQARAGLQRLYDHLKPGGKLIIEIETITSLSDNLGLRLRDIQSLPDGSRIALNALGSYNSATQIFRSTCSYELMINGQVTATEHELFEQYLYRQDEFDADLRAVGCHNFTVYQDHAYTPAQPGAGFLVYVGRSNGSIRSP